MMVLKELWTKEVHPEVKSTYKYALDLNEKLLSKCELARTELQRSSVRYKKHYDSKTKTRTFNVSDFILILLPNYSNKVSTMQ